MTADLLALPRFLLAMAIWILPGFALAQTLGSHLPRGDRLLRTAVAFALAAASSTALAALALATRWPADRFHLVLAAAAVGAGIRLLYARRRAAETRALEADASPASQTAGFATLLLLMVAGVVVGATLRCSSDAPDHVGYLREILASKSYFPTTAYLLDEGILGADARKGLLHPVYAALSRLAGTGPLDFWMQLPVAASLFPFLGGYGFLRLCGLSAKWAVAGGWMVLLTWSGGPALSLIGISPFPNTVGAVLFWMSAGAAIHTLRRPGRPTILLAAGTMFAAAAVHPMFLVFAVLLYGILGLYAITAAGDRATALKTLFLAGGLAALLLLPYVIYRYTMYVPGNPVHTHLQGMLLLSDRLFTAEPRLMWKHARWVGLVAYPLALIVFLPRWRRGPAEFFFGVATLLMLNFTFNPLLVPLLQKSITYLIFRSFWFFTPGLAAAAVLPALLGAFPARGSSPEGESAAGKHPRWRRLGTVLLLAALLLPAIMTLPTWAVPSAQRDRATDLLRWRAAFEEVDRLLPARAAVLTDPFTSHLMPALGSQKVVTAYDQHSPPNDSLAVVRLRRVRDALSPSTSPAEAWQLARAARADYLLINLDLDGTPPTEFWTFDAAALADRARALDDSPFFSSMTGPEKILLFRVEPSPDPASPPDGAAASVEDRWTLPVPAGADTLMSRAGLALLSLEPSSREITCGDTLTLALLWTTTGEAAGDLPRRATLRLDALDAPGRGVPAGKLIRKVTEKLRGKRYRERAVWIPTGNRLPPDRWRVGEAVPDTLILRPSCSLEPGRYLLTVSVNRFPHMANYQLHDYLSDDDIYSGSGLDTLVVRGR